MCKCNTKDAGTHVIPILAKGKRLRLILHRTTHDKAERAVRAKYERQYKAAQRKQESAA